MPATQTLNENSSLAFSNSNAISAFYANDAGTNQLQFTLSVGHGTVQLPTTANLTGSGNGTDSMTYTGTLANINNALNNLIYTPVSNYSGTDKLTIAINNLAGADSAATRRRRARRPWRFSLRSPRRRSLPRSRQAACRRPRAW